MGGPGQGKSGPNMTGAKLEVQAAQHVMSLSCQTQSPRKAMKAQTSPISVTAPSKIPAMTMRPWPPSADAREEADADPVAFLRRSSPSSTQRR